jgi:hypothetical protein
MLQMKDPQDVAIALSDPTLLEINGPRSPNGLFFDHASTASSVTFWKYWLLDLECCKAELFLLNGLVQLIYGRFLKSSV